jgi:hypothetical protein
MCHVFTVFAIIKHALERANLSNIALQVGGFMVKLPDDFTTARRAPVFQPAHASGST